MRRGLANGVQLYREWCLQISEWDRDILAEQDSAQAWERGADEGQKHATDGLLKTKGCTGQVVGKYREIFD